MDIHQKGDHRREVEQSTVEAGSTFSIAGVAGWILRRFRQSPQARPRLTLLERINLAPRQTVALVEAEGRRLLVATSQEGAPSFYSLDERPTSTRFAGRRISSTYRRITW